MQRERLADAHAGDGNQSESPDAVEAGCKQVVGTPLEQAGMHWTTDGGNAILALRCAVSNRLDDFGCTTNPWQMAANRRTGTLTVLARNRVCVQRSCGPEARVPSGAAGLSA